MISFIAEHRAVFGVEPICRPLPIAPSTYYENIAKREDVDRLSVRARSDIASKIEIRREENFWVYGVRKVWRQLKREGFDLARCTVARLVTSMGLQGIIRGKPIRTTVPDKTAPGPLDRVNCQFKAPAPNRLWVSDFTYVATWQGFVYVAFVIDAFARRIDGWRVSRTAHASMPWNRRSMIGVLSMAAVSCIPRTEAFNTCRSSTRSDRPRRESNLPSEASATATTTPSPKRSTGSTRPRSSIGAARGGASKQWDFATLEWVDWFNHRRLLEPIGNIPPAEAEEHYYAMPEEPAMAA
ncbi:transposase InsO family protein [Rhizobium mongolense]|uniref:Transposase InsO family protein n=2 Tax=Rhizobium mongolense TaxID=57676 RepID=A0ABR6IZ68_9HYPH|nr:transposase InsO family protein [Rhizobium mongolense]TVZ75098.1 transposase InsO family protein [Rhizobium mongolense USDA 1844]